MAIIRTMKGEKSNFHIKAMSMNPRTIRIVMDTAYIYMVSLFRIK